MRVAPFVFVGAVRYGINRVATGCSQHTARQVMAHAASIRRDWGCSSAIIREVEDWIGRGDGRGQPGVSPEEIAGAERLWLQAVEALRTGA